MSDNVMTRHRPLPSERPVAAERITAGGRALPAALFAVYLVLLVWIVMWKLEVPFIGTGSTRNVKLIPFAAGGGDGASAPLEVAANLLLFVPFGIYLGLLAAEWSPARKVGTIAGASALLELSQYALAVGRTDVTDVIVNTAGGAVGLVLFALVRRRLTASAAAAATRLGVIATVLAVTACAAFSASPLRYAQQDGAPAQTSGPSTE
jgi:glycopeptide antibiotics resistance protein